MIKSIKPNYSKLGPKYKDKAKLIINKIESLDKTKMYDELTKNKEIVIELDKQKIKLTKDDFSIIEEEKPNIASEETEDMILFIETTMTPELEAEGFAREIVRRIQSMRKEMDLDVEDKISTQIKVDSEREKSLQKWINYIKEETRSKIVTFVNKPTGKLIKKWNIDEIKTEIGVKK